MRIVASKFQGLSRIEATIIIAVLVIVALVVFVSLRLAQADARNAQRLSDIRQIAEALELFRNDHGRYPATLGNKPTGGSPPFDTYMIWPTAPRPPDGACNAQQNAYTYTPVGSPPSSYQLVFCLGRTTDGLAAGVRTATPQGIK